MPSFRPDPNILKKHPNAITQQQIEEKSRFVGTLLGAAAGEALGAPHEFKSASELRPVPREITGGAVSDDVRAAIERGAARSPDDLRVDGEDRGYVLRTVELAFSALVNAKDFEDGVVAVISRGGDTDTNACVAARCSARSSASRAFPNGGFRSSRPRPS